VLDREGECPDLWLSTAAQDPEKGPEEGEFGPETEIKVPTTFQGWMALIGKTLAPAEEVSPFKLGQVQQLIGDINKDAGLFVAPVFTMGQIVFLLAFVVYLAAAIFALALDFDAFDAPCAEEHWVWLYVLLVTAIPTGLGFVMGIVKTVLLAVNLKKRIGWDIPPVFLSFPGPVSYIVLGIFGILLWANMDDGCDSFYESNHFLLYTIFHIQVIVMGVAAIFGTLTCFAQGTVFIASLNPKDPDLEKLKEALNEAESNLQTAEREYQAGAEQIVARLKKELAEAERERDDLKQQLAPEDPDGFKMPTSFNEFSDLMVKWLSPLEEVSPFKLGQIQILISDINKEAGEWVAPYFAIGMVFFLMAFAAYFVLAIIALVLDFEAMDAACAEDSWVWLYVLLVVVIPTSLGFVMGLVKTGLNIADLKGRFGWEIPAVFLALPGPILYIVLGVLGWVLWFTMEDSCTSYYETSVFLLFVIFRIQVILMTVATVFGLITCVAQASVLIAQMSAGKEEDAGEAESIKSA